MKTTKEKKAKKPKIQIIDQSTDSFGTLHVRFIGHDGKLKTVSFDEGDHHAFSGDNWKSL